MLNITKEEIKQFIIETVEEANDKKLGRIISLLFRATSHIDVIKEQNNLLYYSLNNAPNDKEHYLMYPKWSHPITELAEEKVKKQDEENIINANYRKKKDS